MFQRTNVHLALVLAIAAVILFLNLGSARLWDRDEPRNAGCVVEMMQRGDWVVPMFNDELRHQKPVLLYWLIGSAYRVFGVNEFAARFWSAILALATVTMTYVIGRRLLNPGAAVLGALALATSLMFVVAGRAATPDSALIFCQTLALTIYICGTFAVKKHSFDPPQLRTDGAFFPRSHLVVATMYAAMGMGVLAKGLIGIVMPMAIIGLFMLIETRPAVKPRLLEGYGNLARFLASVARPFGPKHFLQTLLKMNPLLAVAMVSIVAGPWFALVGLRTDGEFLKLFFVDEHLGRATTTFENHGGGLWFYPLAIAIGFFPWSIFLVPMLLGIDRRLSKPHPMSTALVFFLCWTGVQIGVFSLVSTKLPSYVTPCFPALALCCGYYLERIWREKTRVPLFMDKAVLVALACSGLGLSIGLTVLCLRFLGGSYWLIALGLLWVVVAALGWLTMARQGSRQWIVVYTAAAAAFCIGLFGYGTIAVDQTQQVQRLLDPIRGRDVPVATFRCLESSWVFYAGQPINELATSEQTAEASVDRVHFWQRKPRLLPAEFAKKYPNAFFITTEQAWFELQSQLPSTYRIVQTAPYFLRDKNLLLAGPVSNSRVAEGRDVIGVR